MCNIETVINGTSYDASIVQTENITVNKNTKSTGKRRCISLDIEFRDVTTPAPQHCHT